jgi:hypothetical protein
VAYLGKREMHLKYWPYKVWERDHLGDKGMGQELESRYSNICVSWGNLLFIILYYCTYYRKCYFSVLYLQSIQLVAHIIISERSVKLYNQLQHISDMCFTVVDCWVHTDLVICLWCVLLVFKYKYSKYVIMFSFYFLYYFVVLHLNSLHFLLIYHACVHMSVVPIKNHLKEDL